MEQAPETLQNLANAPKCRDNFVRPDTARRDGTGWLRMQSDANRSLHRISRINGKVMGIGRVWPRQPAFQPPIKQRNQIFGAGIPIKKEMGILLQTAGKRPSIEMGILEFHSGPCSDQPALPPARSDEVQQADTRRPVSRTINLRDSDRPPNQLNKSNVRVTFLTPRHSP
jgi:hypothetical protein